MKGTVWLLIFVAFNFFVTTATAQESQPFQNEIIEFKKADSAAFPPANSILFVGSSSIKMWDNLEETFPGYSVLNRGFGGSNLVDLARYMEQIVFPYQPKQIVIYSGENDLAPGDITPDTAFQRFVHVFELIRSRMPNVPIVFVSIKPSPSRNHLKHLMIATNRRIKEYLSGQQAAVYVDVYNKMIDGEGQPLENLFIADNLHMNQQGYEIWKKAIEPHLLK